MHFAFKTKLKFLLLLPLTFFALAAQAQVDYVEEYEADSISHTFTAPNALYLEVGNNSDVYSINYDRILYRNNLFKAAVRVGIGTNMFIQESEPSVYPVVPIEAIGLFGRQSKHFELGFGYTRRFTDEPDLLQNLYFGRLGFRYQKPGGGLVVRVALTPFISPENKSEVTGNALVPRFGLSIGRSF